MALKVNLEHLVTSAAQITGHGEDVAAAHLSADNQIAAAQAGWTGRSAEALARRAALWAENSTALVARIGNHANDFYACSQAFSTMEHTNVNRINLTNPR